MILKVQPAAFVRGAVHVPSSKSYSIRAFMIAACGGISFIRNPSPCDDARVSMRVARNLGAQLTRLHRETWKVAAKRNPLRLSHIHVGESGTVLRFILPLVALYGRKATIGGQGTLKGRPNLFLTRTLRSMGVEIFGEGRQEGIPIRIQGGSLRGGNIQIDGSLSSQFISALLIACPQMGEDTSLTLTGQKIVSADYITMTMQVLDKSGVKIRREGLRRYVIPANQRFKGLKNFTVPADYGLAAFLMAAAVLNKSDVALEGAFDDRFVQADSHILRLLEKMGVKFQKTSKSIRMKGPFCLKGGDFSLKDCPDLVPVMAILALFADGPTRLLDIGHARVKESDRISDLGQELRKIGAKVVEKRNEIVIYPQNQYKTDCLLDPHRDHRLAMSFAILGSKLGMRIRDIECVSKSYPGFIRDLKRLGVQAVGVR
ncbi:MAG: 3-phosphoshikimate 1-carboxyvinyltransferase [Omnitrophica WOR_2 bacterium RIFCSPLOWO2_12_FULL_50_9]|nr:MAG: 3-phosphoshikimate 1-carboxyvinyltransferase [Omnitrophica WOR_2 bacterium RIFCSPLOWO2_12_FULL_50_9]